MSEPSLTLTVDGERLGRNLLLGCILFEIFLVLIDACINYGQWIDLGPIRRLCNIAREDGLASWFQTIQTFCVGLLLLLISWLQRPQTERREWLGWLLLGLFFIGMAADDGAEIHERIGSAFKALVEEQAGPSGAESLLGFFPSYPWQMLFLPLLSVAGLSILYFLWSRLDFHSRRSLLLAFGLLGLAVLFDFVEGLDEAHRWNLHQQLMQTWQLAEYPVRHFAKAIEEFLEMLAISLLLATFVGQLLGRLGRRGVLLVGKEPL